MSQALFITDFDGVICDSVVECLLVTYNAYSRLHTPSFQRILNLEAISPEKQREFRRLRPYLKGAEDFVPMFLAIEQSVQIAGQEEFNRFRDQHQKDLGRSQEAFYEERDYLQRYEKDIWLRLNPLFKGVGEALQSRKSFDTVHILTTKRQNDVLAIFDYYAIPFPEDHVTYMKAAGKSQKLLDILQAHNASLPDSVYIEDQVDFLVSSKAHGIGSYLVAWGYVSEEQKAVAQQQHIPIIELKDFRDLLVRYP